MTKKRKCMARAAHDSDIVIRSANEKTSEKSKTKEKEKKKLFRLLIMFRTTIKCSRRQFSQVCGLLNKQEPLPSTPEMKRSWVINNEGQEQQQEASHNRQGNNTKDQPFKSFTHKVIGMTENLQGNNESPLDIDTRFTKRFNMGDSYDPFDFSSDQLDIDNRLKRNNMGKENSRDPFERTGINPLNLYTMPSILSKFLSSTGQILSRDITGCSPANQKKLAMAIKRARVCGILSYVHKDSKFLPTRNI